MDPVFDAQYLNMKHSFSRENTEIDVAYTPAGEVDYIYVANRLLAVDRDDNLQRLRAALPGLGPAERLGTGDLVLLPTEGVDDGHLTVPEVLDLLDERLGAGNPALTGGAPLATPDHVLHTARLCTPWEPMWVPAGAVPHPAPAPQPLAAPHAAVAGQEHNQVLIGISDTGLWEAPDLARHPWMTDVQGDPDGQRPVPPDGLRTISHHAAHGTFVAGVAKSAAPGAAVYVGNHFPKNGGELEHVVASHLEGLIRAQSPQLINFSAGAYTRRDWPLLSFSEFHRMHDDIPLVAAAGNDGITRPHWPAAFDWAVSVGALAADERSLAWFSNHGDWVKMYVVGEGLVNAFATGVYTYQEPPKRPAKQAFDGMARWDGTSFSVALATGLIAAEMARSGDTARIASDRVIASADQHKIRGAGPSLRFLSLGRWFTPGPGGV